MANLLFDKSKEKVFQKRCVRQGKRTALIWGLILVLTVGVLLTGCGKSGGGSSGSGGSARSNTVQSTSKTVNDVLEEGVQNSQAAGDQNAEAASDQSAETGTGNGDKTAAAGQGYKSGNMAEQGAAGGAGQAGAGSENLPKGADGVDVDLTSLSSTIVYSEVYNMMTEPEAYVGKVVRMNGTFVVYHVEKTNTNYYACIIKDATACCSQGMEFVLDDSYTYPEDYPEEGQQIVVEGTFETYMEDDYMYCTLRDAHLIEG